MEKQNNEKLTDKAFIRLTLTSILAILVCLACICGASWAWFTETVPSSNNVIKGAGNCLLSVSVKENQAELGPIEVFEEKTFDNLHGEYLVTLTLPAGDASGYLVVIVGEQQYYTQYIYRHNEQTPKMISFTLKVEQEKSVTFAPRWGIYSGASDVIDGGILTI